MGIRGVYPETLSHLKEDEVLHLASAESGFNPHPKNSESLAPLPPPTHAWPLLVSGHV